MTVFVRRYCEAPSNEANTRTVGSRAQAFRLVLIISLVFSFFVSQSIGADELILQSEHALVSRTGITALSCSGYHQRGMAFTAASCKSLFGEPKRGELSDARYTGCSHGLMTPASPPHWSLTARKALLEGDVAQLSGVWFYIKNQPVFYMPWYRFSLSGGKISGLSFPHIFFDSSAGFGWRETLTWAFSPRSYLMSTLEWRSRRGFLFTTRTELSANKQAMAEGVWLYGKDSRGKIDRLTGLSTTTEGFWVSGSGYVEPIDASWRLIGSVSTGTEPTLIRRPFIPTTEYDLFLSSGAVGRLWSRAGIAEVRVTRDSAVRKLFTPAPWTPFSHIRAGTETNTQTDLWALPQISYATHESPFAYYSRGALTYQQRALIDWSLKNTSRHVAPILLGQEPSHEDNSRACGRIIYQPVFAARMQHATGRMTGQWRTEVSPCLYGRIKEHNSLLVEIPVAGSAKYSASLPLAVGPSLPGALVFDGSVFVDGHSLSPGDLMIDSLDKATTCRGVKGGVGYEFFSEQGYGLFSVSVERSAGGSIAFPSTRVPENARETFSLVTLGAQVRGGGASIASSLIYSIPDEAFVHGQSTLATPQGKLLRFVGSAVWYNDVGPLLAGLRSRGRATIGGDLFCSFSKEIALKIGADWTVGQQRMPGGLQSARASLTTTGHCWEAEVGYEEIWETYYELDRRSYTGYIKLSLTGLTSFEQKVRRWWYADAVA